MPMLFQKWVRENAKQMKLEKSKDYKDFLKKNEGVDL